MKGKAHVCECVDSLERIKRQSFIVPLASPLKDVGEPGQNTIKVNVTVKAICHAVDHTLVVCFGQRKMGSDEECDFSGGVSLREDGVQPGVPHTFTANESVLSLSSGQQYCYTDSLLGDAEEECSSKRSSESQSHVFILFDLFSQLFLKATKVTVVL